MTTTTLPDKGLDDLMRLMDIVDEARHAQALVVHELGQSARDDELKTRLRAIYEAQGLTVTDAMIEEGIKALRENRFTYVRRGSDFLRRLAGLWIARVKIGIGAAALAMLVLAGVGYNAISTHRAEQARLAEVRLVEVDLPQRLERARAAALAEAVVEDARTAIETLSARAREQIAARAASGAAATIGEIEALRERLVQAYVLRIVNEAGVQSGIWRVPDANRNARNYYLVVRAFGPDGRAVSLPITSEETRRTTTTSLFAVRVSQEAFEAVGADYSDDGIIQNDRVGEKRRGHLDIDWSMPVTGGFITQW